MAKRGDTFDPGRRETLKKLALFGALAAVDLGTLVSCRRTGPPASMRERNVIVLGLDGLDANLTERWMAAGLLPNLRRLQDQGSYRRLTSSIPPQSPVAWASFITGTNPGRHKIFDFIARDPKTYFPYLSIARTSAAHRTLSVGKWEMPLSGAKVECLRQGPAFWEGLAQQGMPCAIYRMPTNFPTGASGAQELAGLGAPDLRGSYGEFSYYTDLLPENADQVSGGRVTQVSVLDGHVRATLTGPANTLQEKSPDTKLDFDVWLDAAHKVAKIVVQGQEVLLKEGEWSPWVPLQFELVPHLKGVAGMCLFYLRQVSPHFQLYVSPVNVDPLNPALPVTSPVDFGRQLAERFGRFYTVGFPEDVKALRHGIFDDAEYLHQSGLTVAEARRMYARALHEHDRGLLFYYFSVTDRTQHMFWRTMDPQHPAYQAKLARDFGPAILDVYREADQLVGQALAAAGRDTTLLVMSDHGFCPYYRSFNLNAWLAQHGYLAGLQPWQGKLDIFSHADWANTSAYGVGFNALYLNLRGREVGGSVDASQRDLLLRRLTRELREIRDPKTSARVIENVYPTDAVYPGGDLSPDLPDLIVGYARGYRCSDDSVLGDVTEQLLEDNTDKWSGDHCADRSLVPGVLFANKPLRAPAPTLPDVTATVLAELGAPSLPHLEGKSVL